MTVVNPSEAVSLADSLVDTSRSVRMDILQFEEQLLRRGIALVRGSVTPDAVAV